MEIRKNLERVREKIGEAAIRAGRNPQEIKILGATKTVDVLRIKEAIDAGLRLFGENRVQEGIGKIEAISDEDIEIHFIGVLQSNKLKKAIKYFSAIHSISSFRLAKKADFIASEMGIEYPVLFELNLSGERSKSGFGKQEFIEVLPALSSLESIHPIGLMTIPPLGKDPRPYFSELKEIFEKVKRNFGTDFRELSMGMSDDYEVAVEEGATIVRIGRAIFGERR